MEKKEGKEKNNTSKNASVVVEYIKKEKRIKNIKGGRRVKEKRCDWKKLLCMVLVAVFVVQLVPSSVLAEMVESVQAPEKTEGTVIATETDEPATIQGDVVKLIKADGTVAASYTYDPWGKILTSTGDLANINPLRYRGYYYDTETGLYYLQSRYYDPEIGRFINADSYTTTDSTGILSANMYAYCENDPVNRNDPTGEIWATVAKIAIGAVVNVVTTVVSNAIAGAPLTDGIGEAAIEGALTATMGTAGGVAVSVAFSVYKGVKAHKSVKEIATDAVLTSLSTVVGGGAGKLYGKLKFNNFINTSSKQAIKRWGNSLAQKPMGNLYKNIANWDKKMKRKAIDYYAGDAYGTYLSNLFGSGTTIVSTTLHTRPR